MQCFAEASGSRVDGDPTTRKCRPVCRDHRSVATSVSGLLVDSLHRERPLTGFRLLPLGLYRCTAGFGGPLKGLSGTTVHVRAILGKRSRGMTLGVQPRSPAEHEGFSVFAELWCPSQQTDLKSMLVII